MIFGHAKGAFTGAIRDRVGRFQLADGGSLFLDEVGEIPLALQAKLLRVLQEGSFERVGEKATRKMSVRVIAATNRDLRQEVEVGRFRRDLYYRLSVFPLELPPLRDRRDDIPALAEHFIKLSCGRLGRPEIKLTVKNVERLQDDWPGNVRELQNMIERAVILSKGDRLRLDLALATTATRTPFRTASRPRAADGEQPRIMKCKDLKQMQRDNIIAALGYTRWKIYGPKGAARDSGRQPVNPRCTNEIIRHQKRPQQILSPARRSLCGQKVSQLLAVRRDHEDEQLRRRSRAGSL